MASTADDLLQSEAAEDFFRDSLGRDHAFMEHIYQNAPGTEAGDNTVIVSA